MPAILAHVAYGWREVPRDFGGENPGNYSGAGVSLGTVAVEIAFLWRDVVFDVVVLSGPEPFILGEQRGDYPVPRAMLGAARYPLVSFEDDTPCVLLPPASESSGGETGRVVRRLQQGESIRIVFGDLVLLVTRLVSGERLARPRPKLDLGFTAIFLATAVLHLAVVGWAAFSLPSTKDIAIRSSVQPLFVTAEVRLDGLAIPEQGPVPIRRRDIVAMKNSQDGVLDVEPLTPGKRLGDPSRSRAQRRPAVQGPKDNPDPHLAAQLAHREAYYWGLGWDLQYRVGDPSAPIAKWGRDTSLGVDEWSSRAPEWMARETGFARGDSNSPPLVAPARLRKVLTFVGAQPLGAERDAL